MHRLHRRRLVLKVALDERSSGEAGPLTPGGPGRTSFLPAVEGDISNWRVV
jgi:hypothetical protein